MYGEINKDKFFEKKVKTKTSIFKVNGKLVRMNFSDTDKTAEDCLTKILESLYR